MKYLLTIILICISVAGFSQVDTTRNRQRINAYGYDYNNIGIIGSFKPPQDTFRLAIADTGSIAVIGNKMYVWNLNANTLKWDLISGSGGGSEGPTAIIKNANYGGYNILNFHNSVDSVIAKQLIAGTNVTIDSTANTITINASGTTYTEGWGIDIVSTTILADSFSVQSRARGLKLVDSTLSLILANNGTNKSGNTIKLGGNITAATSINPSGFALDITTDNVATTQTNFTGINLVNNTAAVLNGQQYSPGLRFRSSGWKTTATAGAQTIDIREWTQPIQGTTAPTAFHNFEGAINGGTYWRLFGIFTGGGIQTQGIGGTSGGLSFTSATPAANTIFTGTSITLQTSGTTANTAFFLNANNGYANTSGNMYLFNAVAGTTGFAPTSGNATFTHTFINPIINQTGGASGITYGVQIAPTLTAAADWRAISVANGRSFLKGLVVGTGTTLSNSNYTVGNDDYFIATADLTAEAANRSIVMPAANDGRMLVVFNLNSDATYKWSFSTTTVEDATGSAITTLQDQKTYTLVYHSSKWRVTSVY